MKSKVNTQAVFAKTMEEYAGYYRKAGKPMPNPFLLSKSSLVMTAAVSTGITVMNFYANTNTGPAAQNWEIRLAQTDSFTAYRIGIKLYGLIGTSTGPAGSTSYNFWTHSPMELAKAFVTMMPIYDGNTVLNMNLNSINYLKNWNADQHFERASSAMPFEAITTSGSPSAARLPNTVLGDAGMVDCEPTIRIQGNWNNNITLTVGNPLGIAPVTNFAYLTSNNDTIYINVDHVNLVLEGLLAQNVTAVLG